MNTGGVYSDVVRYRRYYLILVSAAYDIVVFGLYFNNLCIFRLLVDVLKAPVANCVRQTSEILKGLIESVYAIFSFARLTFMLS